MKMIDREEKKLSITSKPNCWA